MYWGKKAILHRGLKSIRVNFPLYTVKCPSVNRALGRGVKKSEKCASSCSVGANI